MKESHRCLLLHDSGSLTLRRRVRGCVGLGRLFYFALLACVFLCSYDAGAQSAEFNPIKGDRTLDDSEEGDEPAKANAVFSFGRFEARIRSLCAELELDQRRKRLYTLAQLRAKDPSECPSCRALWRSVGGACRDGTKKADERKPSKKKKKADSEHSAEGGEGAEELAPTPTPTPTPVPPARMPSTALLDTASRLSTSFYEVDPQQGGIYQAVANLTKTLLGISDLTPAERDYYGILTTYLLCAWDGRELDAAGGSATEQRSKKRAEREQLNQLFE